MPVPFECEYACRVDNYTDVENALHIAFSPNRINPRREFFQIEPEQAIAILKLLAKDDLTPQVLNEFKSETEASDIEAGKRLKIQRRPRLNFTEMGIAIGSKLIFTEDGIEVVVASDNKVIYHDEQMSLTRATREILRLDYDVQPTRYWTYNGKNLWNIYNDTYEAIEC